MAENTSAAALRYYELVRQGVAPAEAFKQAFPNGIPTAADRAKEAATEQQKQALGQIGGTLAGALGTAYLVKNVPAWLGTEAAKNVGTTAATSTLGSAAATGGGAAAGGGMAGGVTEAGAALAPESGLSLSGVAVPAAVVAGTYLGGKALYDMYKGKKPGLPGRVIAGVATGGLSEVAKATGLLGHKSTKDYQQDKWNDIASSQDQATAGYGKQYLNYLGSDQAKEDAQFPNTFEGKKEAGNLKAEDVWGGEAFFDTYGSDWLNKYSEDQRRQIAQQAIDNDLLTTNKGMLVAKSPDQLLALGANLNKPQQPGSNLASALGAKPLPGAIAPVQRPTSNLADMNIARPLSPAEIKNTSQFGNALVGALSKLQTPANNPNSPGFRNGKRIAY